MCWERYRSSFGKSIEKSIRLADEWRWLIILFDILIPEWHCQNAYYIFKYFWNTDRSTPLINSRSYGCIEKLVYSSTCSNKLISVYANMTGMIGSHKPALTIDYIYEFIIKFCCKNLETINYLYLYKSFWIWKRIYILTPRPVSMLPDVIYCWIDIPIEVYFSMRLSKKIRTEFFLDGFDEWFKYNHKKMI